MLLSKPPSPAAFIGRRDYYDAIMHKPNLPPISIHPVIAAALAVGLASAKPRLAEPRLAEPRLAKPRPAETANFAGKTRYRSAQP
jgi:hypothetical protein